MEVIITKSTNDNNKYDSIVDGKRISFGPTGYEAFTTHRDLEPEERYIALHRTNEKWGIDGIKTVGVYSRWVLRKTPAIELSIADLDNKCENIKSKYFRYNSNLCSFI